jgi:hypothetical protein
MQCKSIPKQYYHGLWPTIPGDNDNAKQSTNAKAGNNGYAVVRCGDRRSLADIRIRNNAILSHGVIIVQCAMLHI